MSAVNLETLAIEVLQAEIQRRAYENGSTKPACGSTTKRGGYNVPTHVMAVFLILIVSTVGE